jgi:hypothetical protein
MVIEESKVHTVAPHLGLDMLSHCMHHVHCTSTALLEHHRASLMQSQQLAVLRVMVTKPLPSDVLRAAWCCCVEVGSRCHSQPLCIRRSLSERAVTASDVLHRTLRAQGLSIICMCTSVDSDSHHSSCRSQGLLSDQIPCHTH